MRSIESDETLAYGAAKGDIANFEEILKRYRNRIYRICYRMAGNGHDAEDWTQECFVRAFSQLDRYDHRQPFSPWFMRLTCNTCINLGRSRGTRRPHSAVSLETAAELAAPGPGPMDAMLSAEETSGILNAVASLPPPLRQAITLRLVNGMSFQELALTMGVPLQTAASRFRRALVRVKESVRASGLEEEI